MRALLRRAQALAIAIVLISASHASDPVKVRGAHSVQAPSLVRMKALAEKHAHPATTPRQHPAPEDRTAWSAGLRTVSAKLLCYFGIVSHMHGTWGFGGCAPA